MGRLNLTKMAQSHQSDAPLTISRSNLLNFLERECINTKFPKEWGKISLGKFSFVGHVAPMERGKPISCRFHGRANGVYLSSFVSLLNYIQL